MFRPLLIIASSAYLASCRTTPMVSAFDLADADKDGRVTKAEFDNFMSDSTFARYDANRDGKVTFEEWKAVDPTADMPTFKRIDTDGNGSVSPEEGRAAVRRKGTFDNLFAEVDTKQDGVIDRAESANFSEKLGVTSNMNFPGLRKMR